MALKKNEVAKFKRRLEELRSSLTKTVLGSTEEAKKIDETAVYSQHQAEQGTDDFDRTVALEVTSKEFGILKQIERALEKIGENTYGVCDVTGEEIPIERLDAVPYATMTVKAQSSVEAQGKGLA